MNDGSESLNDDDYRRGLLYFMDVDEPSEHTGGGSEPKTRQAEIDTVAASNSNFSASKGLSSGSVGAAKDQSSNASGLGNTCAPGDSKSNVNNADGCGRGETLTATSGWGGGLANSVCENRFDVNGNQIVNSVSIKGRENEITTYDVVDTNYRLIRKGREKWNEIKISTQDQAKIAAKNGKLQQKLVVEKACQEYVHHVKESQCFGWNTKLRDPVFWIGPNRGAVIPWGPTRILGQVVGKPTDYALATAQELFDKIKDYRNDNAKRKTENAIQSGGRSLPSSRPPCNRQSATIAGQQHQDLNINHDRMVTARASLRDISTSTTSAKKSTRAIAAASVAAASSVSSAAARTMTAASVSGAIDTTSTVTTPVTTLVPAAAAQTATGGAAAPLGSETTALRAAALPATMRDLKGSSEGRTCSPPRKRQKATTVELQRQCLDWTATAAAWDGDISTSTTSATKSTTAASVAKVSSVSSTAARRAMTIGGAGATSVTAAAAELATTGAIADTANALESGSTASATAVLSATLQETKEFMDMLRLDVSSRSLLIDHCRKFLEQKTELVLNEELDDMKEEDFEIVLEALKSNTTIKSLRMNYLEAKPYPQIAEMLKSNEGIERLDLSKNQLGNDKCSTIVASLKRNKTIAHLDLSWNNIEKEGALVVADYLKTNNILTKLNLQSNFMGNDGCVSIACALEENTSLSSLNVQSNNLGTEALFQLAKTLAVNEAIAELCISDNLIQREGYEALIGVLKKDNTTLTKLDFRNVHPKVLTKGQRKQLDHYLNLNLAGRNLMMCETTPRNKRIEILIKTHHKVGLFFQLLRLKPDFLVDTEIGCDDPLLLGHKSQRQMKMKRNRVYAVSNLPQAVSMIPRSPNFFNNIVDENLLVTDEAFGVESSQELYNTLEDKTDIIGLKLCRCTFDVAAKHIVAKVINSKSTNLSRLYLDQCRIESPSYEEGEDNLMNALANGLKDSARITHLDLLFRGNLIHSGCDALAEALRQNFTLTHLSIKTDSKDVVCAALANALGNNNTLTSLDLHEESVKGESLIAIAHSLRFNTSLQNVSITFFNRFDWKDDITDETLSAFASALKFNLTIKSIVLKCSSDGIAIDSNVFDKNYCIKSKLENSLKRNAVGKRCELILDNTELDTRALSRYISALRFKNIVKLCLAHCSVREAGCERIAAILRVGTTGIRVLDLRHSEIGQFGCKAICRAIVYGNRTLTELNLASNRIGVMGCRELYNALVVNQSLKILDLQDNDIGNDGCFELAPALGINRTLTHLNLMSNKISAACIERAHRLMGNTASGLSRLDLGRNNIGAQGCNALCDALLDKEAITCLNLESNQLGDNACGGIRRLLSINQSLKHLNLNSNSITDNGCIELCVGLDVNAFLQTLDLSLNRIGVVGFEELLVLAEEIPDIATVQLQGNDGIREDDLIYFEQTLRDRHKYAIA